MSGIVLAGDTSGTVTVAAPAVAGSNTLTLPAATDTLVGKATTDTLTNKTLSAPTITGVMTGVGSDSATTYVTSAVTLNNTSNFFSVANTGSIGASGQKWLITGNMVVKDSTGASNFSFQVIDGASTVYASGAIGTTAAGFEVNWHFSFVVSLSGAVTFTMQARDTTYTTGQAIASSAVAGATANKISYINAVRLA